MKRLIIFTCLATLGSAANAQEGVEIDSIGLLSQNQFGAMSRDLGAALTYRRAAPAESLGSLGFNLGVGMSSTRLENRSALDSASSDDTPNSLLMSNLYLQKGLPMGFDVGAFYTSVPDSNISLLGGGVSYELLNDSALTPALSVQGSYSRMSGVDDLKLDTRGIDLSISKGISLLTPYAGIGRIWVNSNPGGGTGLESEEFAENRYFYGANLNFGLLDFSLQSDTVGDTSTYNFKLGVRF